MTTRTLVAGVGNVFLGDDGFGVEVARRLATEPLPEGVEVGDFGIKGVHLAYEALEGWDNLVLVDAMSRGEEPGTLTVLEPEPGPPDGSAPAMDAHRMDPATVLAMVAGMGGHFGRIIVIGCEPEVVDERMELSETVSASVERALRLVRDVVTEAHLHRAKMSAGPVPATDHGSTSKEGLA